ncbi:hypothetical protein GCM10028796_56460 [Ramlibacter monticola]
MAGDGSVADGGGNAGGVVAGLTSESRRLASRRFVASGPDQDGPAHCANQAVPLAHLLLAEDGLRPESTELLHTNPARRRTRAGLSGSAT